MTIRRIVWTIIAAAHIVVVSLGACCSLPSRDQGVAAQLLRWYATMTGADSQYGFFAPDVGPLYRCEFQLRDQNGSTWTDQLDNSASPEARLRLAGMVECAFANGTAAELPEWRQRIVKSWAASMFRRHASAVALHVVVKEYDYPTMAQHRAGTRPSWRVIYQAEIQKIPFAAEEELRP